MPRKNGNKYYSAHKRLGRKEKYNTDDIVKKLRKELIGKPKQKDRN